MINKDFQAEAEQRGPRYRFREALIIGENADGRLGHSQRFAQQRPDSSALGFALG